MTTANGGRFILRAEIRSSSDFVIAYGVDLTATSIFVVTEWLSNTTLYGIGAGNTDSIKFLAALYGLAALVYVVARFYRRSQGIDLDAIHAEIPAE